MSPQPRQPLDIPPAPEADAPVASTPQVMEAESVAAESPAPAETISEGLRPSTGPGDGVHPPQPEGWDAPAPGGEYAPEPRERPLLVTATPSGRIMEMVVARFLCKRDSELTLTISHRAVVWAQDQGVAVSREFQVAITDEWRKMRDLSRCEELVASRHEYFSDLMGKLVEEMPDEVNRYTGSLRPDEYRVLLVYAGREVYDWFSRDHRFGPPPRGKAYVTNRRSSWDHDRSKRPDMALVGIDRRIKHYEALGADTTEMHLERKRRVEAMARGEDPLAGVRRVRAGVKALLSPEEVAGNMRKMALGPRVDRSRSPDSEMVPQVLADYEKGEPEEFEERRTHDRLERDLMEDGK